MNEPATGPILLIGGSGMLGRAWRQLLERRGIPHTAPPRQQLDLLHSATLDTVIQTHPLVVNCAAWTDVDGAEAHPGAARQLNADALHRLAELCRPMGALLVNYGTDYVFSGNGARPYRTDDATDPINAYGHSKLAGEEALAASGCRYLQVRTSWLYAPWGKNFVRSIAHAAQHRPSLKVVNDQHGRPTSAEHLAAATLALLERGAAGTFHVTDGGECTWFDFACRIAAFINPACPVEPCSSAYFHRPARRPAYSVLDLSRTEQILGPMPPWQQNLDDVLKRLE